MLRKKKGDRVVNRRILNLKMPTLLSLLLVIGVAAPLSLVQAAVVPVVNGGFDAPINEEHEITAFVNEQHLDGWTYYTQDLDYYFGTYIPTDPGEYDPVPTDGQVLYVDVAPGFDGLGAVGFEQVLTSGLMAGTYNLSVAVGNPKTSVFNYDDFGGYGIELIAGFTVVEFKPGGDPLYRNKLVGGTVLGSAVGDGDSIGEGLFQTIDLTVDVLGDNALLGAALGIRLYNRNLTLNDASFNTFSGIAFDNVQLSLSPVPVPAAIWLFGSALLGLTGFNMRRKHAALKGSC
jgi:hypothetical protein